MVFKPNLIGVNLVDAIEKDNLHNITLRNGDSLYVPTNQVAVKVDGEVGSPGYVLFRPGEDVLYYIYRSGGATITGDMERIILIYANGEKTTLDNVYRDPDAGSKILVPKKNPEPPTDWLKIFTSTTTIIGSLVSTLILITTVN
jgi:protein involved in polysaccharide export with SLBB domain